ncbi:MAG: DUF2723 domain-containing protein [Candidatus Levybacteria bacterium]|nr:DUF2723 domain-containing protein [Candidatus Levybacteria bacterium]
MPSKRLSIILPLFLLGISFFSYLHNLSLSVYGGDVGDLVTAAVVGGVAHPPGYPLFMVLGLILTRFDFATPAFMVGLISVFSSSMAVLIYYFFSLKLTNSKLISFISSLILAFNYLFWFYAEIAEVFALNNLFVLSLMFVAYLYYKSKEIKYLYLLSLLAGLSLTNHHTIVLLFPSLAILVLANYKKIFQKPKDIAKCILFFILGLSVYIYVPIASYFDPVVNWDKVKDLNSFLHLFLRKDYGTLSAGLFPTPVAAQRVVILNSFLFNLLTQVTIPVVVLSFLGAIYSYLRDKRLFLAILLGFLISGPLFIAYAGFPITNVFFIGIYERFFAMSAIVLLLFLPLGLKYLSKLLCKIINRDLVRLVIGVFLLIPIMLFYYNFPKTDLHNIWVGDYLAYDFLSPLPKNSVLLLSGDTMVFNTWYVHYGLGFRKDVEVASIGGLSGSKYVEAKKKDYLKKHPKADKDPNFPINVIREIAKEKKVFSIAMLQPNSGEKLTWIPYGLTYELLENKDDIPSEEEYLRTRESIWQSFKFNEYMKNKSLATGSLTIAEIPIFYSDSMIAYGNFVFSNYENTDYAFKLYKKSIEIAENNYKSYLTIGVYYSYKKDCELTRQNLTKARQIYPFDKNVYTLSYLNYIECFKDIEKAKDVVLLYNKTFKSDFFKDAASSSATLNEENKNK